jgi:sugar O-acyltransferase (sialic acid O-acetyltransferase NeuD family)
MSVNSILYFGRKNCKYSENLKNFLATKTKNLTCVESIKIFDEIPEDTVIKKKYTYIISFRSFYILKKELINKALVAAINFHPSPPKYRGIGCTNYALYDNSKFYGSTVHIINEKIDNGKILNLRKFRIKKKDTVESLLKKTYPIMLSQAKSVLGYIFKDNNNVKKLIKANKNIKWSKKICKLKDLNNFYRIELKCKKKYLENKIRATNTKFFKPYVVLNKKNYFYNEVKLNKPALTIHGKNFYYSEPSWLQKSEKILVIGGGDLARKVIRLIQKLKKYKIIGYLDKQNYGLIYNVKYLGSDDYLKKIKNINVVLAFGANPKDILDRKNVISLIKKNRLKTPNIISTTAKIDKYSSMGNGNLVFDNVVIDHGVNIKEFSLLNINSVICHDSKVSENVIISPGSIILGHSQIGKDVFIGAHSTINQKVIIEEGCVIGFGSTVVKKILSKGLYYGTPAKKIF